MRPEPSSKRHGNNNASQCDATPRPLHTWLSAKRNPRCPDRLRKTSMRRCRTPCRRPSAQLNEAAHTQPRCLPTLGLWYCAQARQRNRPLRDTMHTKRGCNHRCLDTRVAKQRRQCTHPRSASLASHRLAVRRTTRCCQIAPMWATYSGLCAPRHARPTTVNKLRAPREATHTRATRPPSCRAKLSTDTCHEHAIRYARKPKHGERLLIQTSACCHILL